MWLGSYLEWQPQHGQGEAQSPTLGAAACVRCGGGGVAVRVVGPRVAEELSPVHLGPQHPLFIF